MFGCNIQEITEVIYSNEISEERLKMILDSVRNHERQQELQHTGSVSVKNRRHRAVHVCLWLLCVLLLTAVVLCVYFTTDRNRLLTHNYNLIKQKEKMFKEYNEILNQSRNLTEELQEDITDLKTKSVSEERDQLMNERKELNRWLTQQDQRSDNFKWIYYNFSFYYFSSESKSWSDSRDDCKQRGADLVIINSKEEQEFLQKSTAGYYFWIGLRKEKEVWTWIDESTSTTSFWMNGYPRPYKDYCGLTYTSGFADDSCYDNYGWICENRASNRS